MMADAPFVWLRCVCGAGLWRRYADRLEMVVSPRGGQKRTITMPLYGAPGLLVTCEQCGQINRSEYLVALAEAERLGQ